MAANGFVAKGKSNRLMYRAILEALWPKGYGIPGPILSRDEIRAAVDVAQGKRYKDVFRRLRELQGDEGFLGIAKDGRACWALLEGLLAAVDGAVHEYVMPSVAVLVAARAQRVEEHCLLDLGEGGKVFAHAVLKRDLAVDHVVECFLSSSAVKLSGEYSTSSVQKCA
ncbi:hypothetical protein H6A18_10925 [Collinsella tanakaei]|nr:hypothetical protein [Collinsella tanakaei]